MSDRVLLPPTKFLASRQRGLASASGIQLKSGFCIPRRMRRDARLTGHQGCVNTVSWNRDGTLLLSGSDDCQLNIYQANRRCLLQSIPSGHTANIFSAHFLPRNCDREIVSCAGNGTVHLTHTDRPDLYGYHPFHCHKGTTYEVCVSPSDPMEFYSCGEDGCVRLYDLRRKRKCLCRHNECKKDVLVSLPDSANSLSVHPQQPSYFLVAGGDAGVREFDRRMLTPEVQPHVALYRPPHLEGSGRKITCVRYSPDGHQLLVSYSADYLYLFNRTNSQDKRGILSAPSLHSGGARHLSLPLTTSHPEDPSHLRKHEVSNNEKRIKFRSDWSDTGPAARPDETGSGSGTGFNSDRLSNMFRRFSQRESGAQSEDRQTTADESADQESTHVSIHYMDVPGEEDGVIEGQLDQSTPILVRESPPSPPPCYSPPAEPPLSPVSWYRGHRNVRTMIKQACFWGDSHVVSGSDCGRVFFWNKWSAEIEMFLDADKHVVNCVQPHPTEPTLATSGIDYDIKLFSPCGRSGADSREQLLPQLGEVVRINEEMLEQSYDTFTIPIISLLRLMVAGRARPADQET